MKSNMDALLQLEHLMPASLVRDLKKKIEDEAASKSSEMAMEDEEDMDEADMEAFMRSSADEEEGMDEMESETPAMEAEEEDMNFIPKKKPNPKMRG